MPEFEIRCGDALEELKKMPDESIQCVVTSPPFYGLRDYGTAKWEGGEAECDHRQGRPGAGRANGIVDERAQRNRDGVGYGERAVEATGGAITGGTEKSTLGSSHGKLTGKSETIGFQPSCKCDEPDTVPCLVGDIFMGSGTVGVVALRYHRNFIGVELNPKYCAMAEGRIKNDQPLYNQQML